MRPLSEESRRPRRATATSTPETKAGRDNALLMRNEGDENPFKLWRELGDLMTRTATVIRYNRT